MSKKYKLELQNWSIDDYCVGSKGHHDIEEFKKLLMSDEMFNEWPLGEPKHEIVKAVPNSDGGGVTYYPATKETRGSFPITVCYEHYESARKTVLRFG